MMDLYLKNFNLNVCLISFLEIWKIVLIRYVFILRVIICCDEAVLVSVPVFTLSKIQIFHTQTDMFMTRVDVTHVHLMNRSVNRSLGSFHNMTHCAHLKGFCYSKFRIVSYQIHNKIIKRNSLRIIFYLSV